MKPTRTFRAFLIIALLFVADVHDLILKSKVENLRILQAKRRGKGKSRSHSFAQSTHEKSHTLSGFDKHQRSMAGKKKQGTKIRKHHHSTTRKQNLHKHHKVARSLRPKSKVSHRKKTKHNKKHKKTAHHRKLRYSSFDYVNSYSEVDKIGKNIGSSDNITTLIFLILTIMMLGSFFKKKPNRKLDETPTDGLQGINILDLLMGGTDIKTIMKQEKKKILRYMKDNNIKLDKNTPYKDVLRLTKVYVKKQYNMDDDAFEQFKPMVKSFYKKLIEKKKKEGNSDEKAVVGDSKKATTTTDSKPEKEAHKDSKKKARKMHKKQKKDKIKKHKHHQTDEDLEDNDED
jgi:hypothetical protein